MKSNLIIFFLLSATISYSQGIVEGITDEVSRQEIELHIRFLASDELLGRETGTPEIDIAAAYIAAYYKSLGVKTLPGMDSYFQTVPFYEVELPKEGSITIGGKMLDFSNDFATSFAKEVELNGSGVYVENTLSGKDVAGKIVIQDAIGNGMTYQQALSTDYRDSILTTAKDAGAGAVLFLWNEPQLPWSRLQGWMHRKTLNPGKPEDPILPFFYVNREALTDINNFDGEVTVSYSGREINIVNSYNVVGYIEGSDEKLKENYLLLGAHYDHVGGEFTTDGEDKIYNGARDNAVGTAAIMMAADYLSRNTPTNSVIFAAWTAEEKGLLGSKYFVENSPIALDKIFFNLNIDNAGYNDTSKVTVIGLDRTLDQDELTSAASEFGLEAVTDPAPEQNLFDRSDNVNFARVGIPSPTFSLGFTAFDQEIFKYYHNVADEADNLDFAYVTRYTRAFVRAVQKIASGETKTFWKAGDKYEDAGKALYNR